MKPTPSAGHRPKRIAIQMGGLAALAALIMFIAWHTDRAARAFDACGVPPDTIPGLAEPRFFLDNDSYAWMAHTRDLMASGGWRIRHTFMDNAPYGRDMHWSHLPIWTLRGMASGIMAATGWPPTQAVELAGVWIMPMFQFLFLAVAFLVLLRKMGWILAALFCGLAVTLDGLAVGFHPLRPDHHGLQLCATLFAFACLQLGGMGWTQTDYTNQTMNDLPAFRRLEPPPRQAACRWMIASGCFGGLALWFGATIWLFCLAAIALAALPAMPPLFHAAEPNTKYVPELWRLWAVSGVVVAAVFYLLEYAPQHFHMRLEVNHPLYWLCWIGVAELLCFIGRSGSMRIWENRRTAEWAGLALGILAVGALPLLAVFGPAEWHHMNQPMLQRLHALFIEEFQGGWSSIQAKPVRFLFLDMGILPVLAGMWLGIILWPRQQPLPGGATMRAALVFVAIFFLLMLIQLRWGYFLAGGLLWFGMLSISFGIGSKHQKLRRIAHLTIIALVLNMVVAGFLRLRMERDAATAERIPPSWAHASLTKRVILQWGMAAGTNQWSMVGMASDAPALYYFAGIRGVASLYWENAAGWKAETEFFTDSPDGERALSIARARGLTHALTPASLGFLQLYANLLGGKTNPDGIRNMLGVRMAFPETGDLPLWLEIDEDLTRIASRPYLIRTPGGVVAPASPSRVYQLSPL
jgi:hypothetical protein